jgi:hypothetical protein
VPECDIRRTTDKTRHLTPTLCAGRASYDELCTTRVYLLLAAASVAATMLAIQIRDDIGLWGWLARVIRRVVRQ